MLLLVQMGAVSRLRASNTSIVGDTKTFLARTHQHSKSLSNSMQGRLHHKKMICIDQLIHAFHQSVRYPVPHRSTGNNLIEGNHHQVVAFLDTLTYGAGNTPGLQETHVAWTETLQEMQKLRHGK